MSERIRTTVAIEPEVLETFRVMADAAGLSISRCIGDWLADTADGAQMVAKKMQEAKTAPVRVMQEMQAMLHGAHGEASDIVELLRTQSRAQVRAVGAQPLTRAPGRRKAPSSNTGLKSPGKGKRRVG